MLAILEDAEKCVETKLGVGSSSIGYGQYVERTCVYLML